MGTKGEESFPPENRDKNCRGCAGYGWLDFTTREHNLIEELNSCHQEVFGSPYFEVHNTVHWGQLPSQRFCPKCCGLERRARDNSQFAQWRLDLRALKSLVSRVQRGEKFGDIETAHQNYPTSKNSWSEEIQAEMIVSSGRTYTYESLYMRIAKKKRLKQSRAGSTRIRPSLSDELTQLAHLKESGDLTEEEFRLAKQKLLGAHNPKGRKRQPRKQEIDVRPPGLLEANQFKFDVGDHVSHPQFGRGRVISISGSGSKTEIEIQFQRNVIEVFALAWAPLTKL